MASTNTTYRPYSSRNGVKVARQKGSCISESRVGDLDTASTLAEQLPETVSLMTGLLVFQEVAMEELKAITANIAGLDETSSTPPSAKATT